MRSFPGCVSGGTGEPGQTRRWRYREGQVCKRGHAELCICWTLGNSSPSTANAPRKVGNMAVTPEKRLVTESWESADRGLGPSASTVTHSPGCGQEDLAPHHGGLTLGCLRVLTAWQLAPPRASDPRSNKQPSEVEVSHIVFSGLVLEVTLHRFCRLLLFTQTNCDAGSEGTAGGVRTRGRWEPPWSGYRTPIP